MRPSLPFAVLLVVSCWADRPATELTRTLVQTALTNCHGLPAELLATSPEALIALLRTPDGRRAVKGAALQALLGNSTDQLRHAGHPSPEDLDQGLRAISVCGNAWLDWIPWVSCPVQSPPPRLHFLDEERDGDEGGPLCWSTDREEHRIE